MLTVPGQNEWGQLVDDGRDTTLVMHKGTELEDAFAKVRILPNSQSAMNPEFKRDWQLAKDSISLDDTKWMRRS